MLLNQPFNGQLGNRLIELLVSPDYETLNIAVAFAKNSGVLRLKEYFQSFREKGGKVNVYVGVDLGGTSYEALMALLLCTDSLNIVHSEKGQTFHSKIYQFFGENKGEIIVGSHNLTGGGLWTNFESSISISVDTAADNNVQVTKEINQYFDTLENLNDSFMPVKSKDDIERLLDEGYVSKEVTQKILSKKSSGQNDNRAPLFGNGVPAPIPKILTPKPQIEKVRNETQKAEGTEPKIFVQEEPIAEKDVSDTIWFETRRLTGGSRNILDLSKRSLVEKGNPAGTRFDLGQDKFMRGGVEFFGVPPTATDQVKDIVINFEGTDYSDNTILFPTGNNPNGTWRLQLKGVSSSGEKITEAFRAKGEKYYLVQKIVTFTKVKDDYYFLSVFPDSELTNFKSTSKVLARNGATRSAKWLGLL